MAPSDSLVQRFLWKNRKNGIFDALFQYVNDIVQMWDMAHSICLIKLYQITMREKFRFFVSDYLKQESRKNWPNRPESYTNDIKVNHTQKETDVFIRKSFPGLYENIINSYTALSSKNEWSLFFSYDLVILSHFKVS